MLAWLLCGLLAIVVIALTIKIILMQKSMIEITDCIQEHLSSDTNCQIFISSNDKYVKNLALHLAEQLKVLKRQRQQYMQGDQELKETITNISHDLRTPLTAIYGYLYLLEAEEKSENVKRYIAQITDRTEAMKTLTEELFRYSIVSSITELKCEKVNICKILENTLLSFYGIMKEQKIEPQITIPDNPIWRQLDVSALTRIYSNIINNAIKYSDGDFKVSVEESGTVIFSNTASNLTAVEVGKLFDRFYTVDTSRKATGIGLSISKVLTERMGGTINAEYLDQKLRIAVKF